MQTIRPASHTTALGELFIAEVRAGVQEGICENRKFTSLVSSRSSVWIELLPFSGGADQAVGYYAEPEVY
jgi:hypothetical protein